MVRLLLCWAGLLVPWSIAYSESIEPQAITRAQRMQVHDEAVHILGGNVNVISRWVSDIRFHVVGTEWFRRQATLTLEEVASVAGLKLLPSAKEPDTAEGYLALLESTPAVQLSSCDTQQQQAALSEGNTCANFIVVQTSNTMMQKMSEAIPLRKVYQDSFAGAQSVSCFFAPFVGSRQFIHQAFVYVSDDLDDAMLQTCLHEEIYQSFGLFNDYTDSVYFSFNNKVEPKSITGYDRELLKTVYHPDFAPGTPVFRVLERFMDVLELDPFGK